MSDRWPNLLFGTFAARALRSADETFKMRYALSIRVYAAAH